MHETVRRLENPDFYVTALVARWRAGDQHPSPGSTAATRTPTWPTLTAMSASSRVRSTRRSGRETTSRRYADRAPAALGRAADPRYGWDNAAAHRGRWAIRNGRDPPSRGGRRAPNGCCYRHGHPAGRDRLWARAARGRRHSRGALRRVGLRSRRLKQKREVPKGTLLVSSTYWREGATSFPVSTSGSRSSTHHTTARIGAEVDVGWGCAPPGRDEAVRHRSSVIKPVDSANAGGLR